METRKISRGVCEMMCDRPFIITECNFFMIKWKMMILFKNLGSNTQFCDKLFKALLQYIDDEENLPMNQLFLIKMSFKLTFLTCVKSWI